MNEMYVYRNSEKLRCGFTTGTCAASASKASAFMLLSGIKTDFSDIITPSGAELHIPVSEQIMNSEFSSCSVKKDSGDDPDITNGVLVYSKVKLISEGVKILGGEGIGIVTRDGLDQPVGEYAINSVPRKMIKQAVCEVAEEFGYSGGFEIEISIPQGVELAKKTMNSHIGIMGGISVIGTTGIVEPMSNKAMIDTIKLEQNVLKKTGARNLLLTLGNYSDTYIKDNLPFDLKKSVKCSNYIGDAIDTALENEFESVLVVGHIGKLVKLGAGIMNTHSSFADGRMEVIITCGVLAGMSTDILKKIPDCATVDAALDIVKDAGFLDAVLDILIKKIEYYLKLKVRESIKIGAVVFSFKHDFTLKTSDADELIKLISEE